MFAALPDAAYEAAGDIIVARKRELEEKIREAGRKRRRVVAARVDTVKVVAEDKMHRLERLTKRREGLRGSVGRLLVENGFAVEF
ncbi:hypothetical protein BZA05DRAFT_393333 [Tricharina praecox]|uniref:uncharacterized protein n=1 Tax=Tricharina praecox TaxID=43433 RepID=UPI00221F6A1F|nr:uncharacterized protein BZA05DRAFT_393333 [Tricharina praecox]KAI5854139.1 hypothetical protein BZA05DRAFT_393333 [Tricharina praecox]